MAKAQKDIDDRERMAEAIARSLPADGGGYYLSAATAAPLRRSLKGPWAVVSHEVSGEPYVDRLAVRGYRGYGLKDLEYRAEYHFRDGVCVKRVDIDGLAELPEGGVPYACRQRMALSWDVDGPEHLRVRPELGYQSSCLGGETASLKELEDAGSELVIRFSLEGDELVLDEGDDRKRLRRLA